MLFMKIYKYSLIGTNAIFFLILIACVSDPYYNGIPQHQADYYPYDYYYYPAARVYFNFTTGFYYYVDNTRWVKSRTLLPRIHLDPAQRVRLRIDNDKPYVKQSEHIKKYEPPSDYRIDKQKNSREREENRRLYEQTRKVHESKQKYDDSNRKERR